MKKTKSKIKKISLKMAIEKWSGAIFTVFVYWCVFWGILIGILTIGIIILNFFKL